MQRKQSPLKKNSTTYDVAFGSLCCIFYFFSHSGFGCSLIDITPLLGHQSDGRDSTTILVRSSLLLTILHDAEIKLVPSTKLNMDII